MRKIISFFTMLAVVLTLSAKENAGRKALEREILRFRESKDMLHKTEHDGQGIYVYNFKYTCKGDEIDDPSFRPAALKRLEKAFDSSATAAMTRYSYSPNSAKSPLRLFYFSWPNSFFRRVGFSFEVNDSTEYRFYTFGSPDSVRSCYALVWKESRFSDHAGVPYRCFDGYVVTLTGNHWEYDVSQYSYYYNRNMGGVSFREEDNGDYNREALSYAVMHEKMNELDNIFTEARRMKDDTRINALLYVTDSLLSKYKEPFTMQQFNHTFDMLQRWMKDTEDSRQRFYIGSILVRVMRNAPLDEGGERIYKRKTYSNEFFKQNLQKSTAIRMFEKRLAFSTAENENRSLWELKGICQDGCQYVEMSVSSSEMPLYNATVRDDNAFHFRPRSMQHGLFTTVSDDKGENVWWLITDSVPVSINLSDGTIEGSELNKRFISYQQRIRNMRKDLHKYTTTVVDDMTVMDEDGYNSVVDSVRKIQYEVIADNPDNIIPAFYLAELCTEMPPSLLDSVMKRGLAYSNHVAMQPAWDFFKGQKKRLPGQQFHDIEVQDTLGISHMLDEYAGKGNYVLLHFWDLDDHKGRKELGVIRKIANSYKDKPLTVVGIYLGSDADSWRKYIRTRTLRWTHLTNLQGFDSPAAQAYGVITTPMTVLIAPDGTIVEQGVQYQDILNMLQKYF